MHDVHIPLVGMPLIFSTMESIYRVVDMRHGVVYMNRTCIFLVYFPPRQSAFGFASGYSVAGIKVQYLI